jgi:hypothetical protein
MPMRLINSIRRNHALEHATIAVMMTRQGPMRVVGRAAADGFYIYGDVSTEHLREFAYEALGRLQKGESHLAVSPLCGTNLLVAGVIAGVGSYLAAGTGKKRWDGLSNALLAAIVGVIASQPIGRLVQKHYTTSPDLEGVRIVSVERMGRRLANLHKVRTASTAA